MEGTHRALLALALLAAVAVPAMIVCADGCDEDAPACAPSDCACLPCLATLAPGPTVALTWTVAELPHVRVSATTGVRAERGLPQDCFRPPRLTA